MIKETIKIIGIILLIYFITIGIVTTITTISDLCDLDEDCVNDILKEMGKSDSQDP